MSVPGQIATPSDPSTSSAWRRASSACIRERCDLRGRGPQSARHEPDTSGSTRETTSGESPGFATCPEPRGQSRRRPHPVRARGTPRDPILERSTPTKLNRPVTPRASRRSGPRPPRPPRPRSSAATRGANLELLGEPMRSEHPSQTTSEPSRSPSCRSSRSGRPSSSRR